MKYFVANPFFIGNKEIKKGIVITDENELKGQSKEFIAQRVQLGTLQPVIDKPQAMEPNPNEGDEPSLGEDDVETVNGIGKSTAEKLNAEGIKTVAQLKQKIDTDKVKEIFGGKHDDIKKNLAEL